MVWAPRPLPGSELAAVLAAAVAEVLLLVELLLVEVVLALCPEAV